MTKKRPTNVAASVRARLLQVVKASGEDFHYVLTRYALERLLLRLVRSAHREAFVLKGAMLFGAWSPTLHRPTKDLDLLGRGVPGLDRLAGIFRDQCDVPVEDDGVTFDPRSVAAQRIKEDADYEGVRVTLRASLGTAKLALQIDVGFGEPRSRKRRRSRSRRGSPPTPARGHNGKRSWREAEWLAPSLLQRRSTPSRDSRGRLSRQRAARDRSPRAGRPRDRGDSADGPSRRIARIAKRPRRRRGGTRAMIGGRPPRAFRS
jgi:hypothetical protein